MRGASKTARRACEIRHTNKPALVRLSPFVPPPPFQVQILVRKVRNKAAGMIGETFLKYDRVNGCYSDVPANELS